MSDSPAIVRPRTVVAGVPPGMVDAVVAVLRANPAAVRRRALLEALEHTGHRISLAGLNRTLQQCAVSGLTTEGPDGVRLVDRSVPR